MDKNKFARSCLDSRSRWTHFYHVKSFINNQITHWYKSSLRPIQMFDSFFCCSFWQEKRWSKQKSAEINSFQVICSPSCVRELIYKSTGHPFFEFFPIDGTFYADYEYACAWEGREANLDSGHRTLCPLRPPPHRGGLDAKVIRLLSLCAGGPQSGSRVRLAEPAVNSELFYTYKRLGFRIFVFKNIEIYKGFF